MERSRLARLRIKRHWSQQRVATLLNVDVMTISRWERGKAIPHGYNLERLCEIYVCSEEELGLQREVSMTVPTSRIAPLITKFATNDLTVRLMTLTFSAHCNYTEIQAKVSLVLEEFDAMDMDSITRREALQRLIALSLSPIAVTTAISYASETLRQCAISLVACQELGKGKDGGDLALAFEGASTVLERLRPIFDSSRHRKAASSLAAQAARLQNVLASHLEGAAASISYAKQAVFYSKQAGDIPEYLLTLIALAHAYHSVPRYAGQALQTIEQAAASLKEYPSHIPLYLHSSVYSTLAIMQAQNGVTSNVARQQAAKLAFADQGYAMFVDDPMYSLVVNEAEAFYHQGDQDQALALLSQLIDSNTLTAKRALSERGHIRVLSDMTQISLKTKNKDLEKSVSLWKATMQGVHTLKSERRFEEMVLAYYTMGALWSDDKRVQALRPLTIHW